MRAIRSVFNKIPGYRDKDSKIKSVIATLSYGFLLFILIVLIIPTAPTLTVDENNLTRFSNVDIKGKTSPNRPLYLIQNGVEILHTKSTSSGGFAFNLQSLSEGSHAYTVEVCTRENKKLCRSELTTIVVDKTPPLTPVLETSGGESTEESILVGGSGEPSSKVKILVNEKVRGEVEVPDSGRFNKQISLSEGTNNLYLVAEDLAGNTSSSSQLISINYTPKTAGIQTELAKVTKVIDGDTIETEGSSKVRYIGIDTPETVHPNEPVGCYGKEASDKNKELVLGKEVRLEKDFSETDKYDRLLRYVWVGDLMVNEYLVREGYAQSSTYPPDVKYQDRFIEAQRKAREEGKGLWSSYCDTWNKTPTPTVKGTTTDGQTTTPTPTQYIAPSTPTPTSPPSGGYTCNCSKTCSQMSSCEEAYYQLNTCGCSKRDGDKDGVPCEIICPGG